MFPDTKNIISDPYSEKSSSIHAPKAFQATILFLLLSADLKFTAADILALSVVMVSQESHLVWFENQVNAFRAWATAAALKSLSEPAESTPQEVVLSEFQHLRLTSLQPWASSAAPASIKSIPSA